MGKGIKLADLQQDRRPIIIPIVIQAVEVGGDLTEDLSLTYRPSAYTGKTEKELNELAKGEWKSEMGLQFVKKLVVSWDLETDDGKPFPIEIDNLAELPSSFVGEVISGIADDMGKDRRNSKSS